jgi:hypothetical protein
LRNIDMKTKKTCTEGSNRIKDPNDWVTGDEEMTGAQEPYLETLASEAHERVEPDLTKVEASKKIDELRQKTGRPRSASSRQGSKPSGVFPDRRRTVEREE